MEVDRPAAHGAAEPEAVKLWVTLDGRDAEVEFRAEGDKLWLEVEGKRTTADFVRLPDGEVYSLLVSGTSHELRVSERDGILDVTLDGITFPVEVRHPLEKALLRVRHEAAATGVEVVAAPMPGLVVALRVKPGDRVEAGSAVVVIEAMKMQNELPTRHGGVVSEVLVRERASVGAGQPLVRIRPEAGR
jgi:biotin carboxyl carrier protein